LELKLLPRRCEEVKSLSVVDDDVVLNAEDDNDRDDAFEGDMQAVDIVEDVDECLRPTPWAWLLGVLLLLPRIRWTGVTREAYIVIVE